jgi:phosphoglycolate phosphatase
MNSFRWKALIFDLDGTLVDTLEDLADSVNEVLERRNFPPHPREEYRFFVGEGMRKLIQRALPEAARDEETLNSCQKAMMETYALRATLKSKPYPGAVELISRLGVLGIGLAVATNKPDELAKSIIHSFFPGEPFAAIQGASPLLPHKPDPEVALRLAQVFAAKPEEIAMIGDSDVDVETALNAGIFPIGAAWGFRGRKELENAGARLILETPLELLGHLA